MTLEGKPPRKASHWWWFDSRKDSPRSSPWLASTISELDEKTKEMLKLIEQDADSFAQRVEMYYKKRPELVNMVEDFYRAHRSLAERCDQLKMETGVRRTGHSGSSFLTKNWLQDSTNAMDKESRTSSNSFFSDESEVEDPEQEENEVDSGLRGVTADEIGNEVMKWRNEEQIRLGCDMKDAPNEGTDAEMMKQMTEELRKLREENKILKTQLLEKDEEKREVIRQLSLSMNFLNEENTAIRKCIKESKKWGLFEFKMLRKGAFPVKFLSRISRFHPAIVSL